MGKISLNELVYNDVDSVSESAYASYILVNIASGSLRSVR
jgi:hypothetical protein